MSLLKKLRNKDAQKVEVRRKTYYKGRTEKALQKYSNSDKCDQGGRFVDYKR